MSQSENITPVEEHPQELIFPVLLHLPYEDILNFCRSSPILWKRYYYDEYLWELLVRRDYPSFKIVDYRLSWRQFYKDLKENFNVKSFGESLGFSLVDPMINLFDNLYFKGGIDNHRMDGILYPILYMYDGMIIKSLESGNDFILKQLLLFRVFIYEKYGYILRTPIYKGMTPQILHYDCYNEMVLEPIRYEMLIRKLIKERRLETLITLISFDENFTVITRSKKYLNINYDWFLVVAASEGCQDIVNFLLYPSRYIKGLPNIGATHYNLGLNAAMKSGHTEIINTISTVSHQKFLSPLIA